jgi:DNA-binding response OmpR family regulator
VLIAEDEAITAFALEQTVLAHGYEVCGVVASGAEARALAERHRPTLAVVDIRLKDGLTGNTVARALQERFGIPVILMSGHSDEKSALDLGAAGFLAKPFSDSELIRTIERVLRAGAEAVGPADVASSES